MSLMTTHIELLKQEVELYDRTGVFLQDEYTELRDSKHVYAGDKPGIRHDPMLSNNSFRRFMRLHAKERGVPFIHACRARDWTRRDVSIDRYWVSIPNQKRLEVLLAPYRIMWSNQNSYGTYGVAWSGKSPWVSRHATIVEFSCDAKHWRVFLSRLQEEPTRSVLKLPERLQEAA